MFDIGLAVNLDDEIPSTFEVFGSSCNSYGELFYVWQTLEIWLISNSYTMFFSEV